MRLLITGSRDYGDYDAMIIMLKNIYEHAGGEVITLVLPHRDGACGIAYEIAEAGPDVGFEWEQATSHSLETVDSVWGWFWHGEQTDCWVDRALELGVGVMAFSSG